MAGGDDERISEEEILAIGGDPFFLPDDESKAKATTEKNQQKRKQQPLLSSPRQQLLQTLDTQYQELGNQYKAIGETISALKKEFGVVDTADTEGERKKNNNSQTASEILSNTAIGSAAGMPSSSLLGSLGMPEDEIEEEKELTMEERKLEIEELGGDPFFLDDQAIDVKSEDDLPKSYENEDSSEKPTAPSEALSRMAMAGGDGETPSILSFLQDYHSPSEDEEEGEKELSREERKLEIEELGGDPFFLGEEGHDDAAAMSNAVDRGQATGTDNVVAEERRPTDGMGPTPRFDEAEPENSADFEWDGIVNEDAHLDFN